MKLYSPVILPFAEELARLTKLHMEQFATEKFYPKNVPISDEFREEINSWLASKGVSKLFNILSFKRQKFMQAHYMTHLDSYEDQLIKNSVVIPVSGCKGTRQYWYDGDYVPTKRYNVNGDSYLSPVWKSPGKLIGAVEILDTPMLCRTDIPHAAYNFSDEYRTTCTIRFADNEDFEYLEEKLST